MTNATSLPDAEATPAACLIVKAALHWLNDDRGTRTLDTAATARMRAFGEVASDVLGIAMTPDGFFMAVAETVRDTPPPYTTTRTRGRAAAERETWQRALVAAVLGRLGGNDLRPASTARPQAPRAAAGSRPPTARPYPSRPTEAGTMFHDITHVRETLAARIGAGLVTDETVAATLAVLAREDITALGITIMEASRGHDDPYALAGGHAARAMAALGSTWDLGGPARQSTGPDMAGAAGWVDHVRDALPAGTRERAAAESILRTLRQGTGTPAADSSGWYLPPGGLAPPPGIYSPQAPHGSPAWTDPGECDVHWCRNYATPGALAGSWSPATQARLDAAATVAELQAAWAQLQDTREVGTMPSAGYRHALAHLYARYPQAAPPAVRHRLPGPPAIPAAVEPGAPGEARPGGRAGQDLPVTVTGLHAAQGHASAAAHVLTGGEPGRQGPDVTGSRGRPLTPPYAITTGGHDAAPEAGQ